MFLKQSNVPKKCSYFSISLGTLKISRNILDLEKFSISKRPENVRAGRSALGCLPTFQLSPRLNPVPTLGASEFIQVRCAQRNGERTRPSGSVGTRLFANISTKSRAPSGAYSPGLENSRTRDTPFM